MYYAGLTSRSNLGIASGMSLNLHRNQSVRDKYKKCTTLDSIWYKEHDIPTKEWSVSTIHLVLSNYQSISYSHVHAIVTLKVFEKKDVRRYNKYNEGVWWEGWYCTYVWGRCIVWWLEFVCLTQLSDCSFSCSLGQWCTWKVIITQMVLQNLLLIYTPISGRFNIAVSSIGFF